MNRTSLPIILLLLVPTALFAQGPELSALDYDEATDELTEQIAALVKTDDVLQKPPIVFESVTPGAAEKGGLCVMVARLAAGDGTLTSNGRLLGLLIDPAKLVRESVLTFRLTIVEGGDRRNMKMAFSTLADEGEGPPELVRPPNTDWTADVMPVPRIPDRLADEMATVGPVKVGIVRAPTRGLYLALGRSEDGQTGGGAFPLPTLTQLEAHDVEWSAGTLLP